MVRRFLPVRLPASWTPRDGRDALRAQRRRWLERLARGDDEDEDAPGVRAHLVRESRYTRELLVETPDEAFLVEYDGTGFAFESVRVDHKEVTREPSGLTMAERFFFALGEHEASIEVEPGRGANLLGPFWPLGLRMFLLVVDGRPLYADGRAYQQVRREVGAAR